MVLIGSILLAVTAVLGVVMRDRLSHLDSWALRDLHVTATSPLGQAVTAVSGAAVLACAAIVLTQQLFQRPGPPVVAADWTYPSGHATIAAGLAFTAIAMALTMVPSWSRAVMWATSVAVVLTLASRVALGEHYVTDVLGALSGVTGIGLITIVVLRLSSRVVPQQP
ncbi:phosphatase PAP2 family protein [Kibdelosporangium aridum]|uniref:phosphatase PAP2 family protein n=1 Tax=Kibdelosporangium aridum TaxID=2030 RepID=UPI0035EBA949